MIELPKRLEKSLTRIKKCGGVVLIHHTSTGSLDYQLPNGGGLSPNTISKLREAGRLVSGKDGLFGDCEQTLHVVAA